MGPIDVDVRPFDLLVDDAGDGLQKFLLSIGKVFCGLIGKQSIKAFDQFVRCVLNHSSSLGVDYEFGF